jgi:pyruvate/2-oxoglutarate dehydrogenase complex dihydrolipoamide dehydrogenase (E3) component
MSSLITVPAIAALGAGTFAVLATRCAMSRTSTSLPLPSPKSQAPENIVVLGGGYAGSQMAREIASKVDPARFNVILINEREYHVHFIATLRMIVTDEGKLEESSLIPYTSLFASDNGQLKIGKAVGIEKRASGDGGDVLLESGEKVAFRYLVLATGSKWEGPLAFPNDHEKIFEWVHDWRRRFADANDLVIVGGGAVGTGT